MAAHIRLGFWAGIVSGAVFAGFDCNFLLFGTGSFWLSLRSVFTSLIIYLLLGAFAGVILGCFLSIPKRVAQFNSKFLFKGEVYFLTFTSLVIFGCVYLYDYGFGQSSRGEFWHYLLVLPLALIASIVTWSAMKFFLYLFESRKNQLMLATGTIVAVIILEIILIRFFFPDFKVNKKGINSKQETVPNILLLVMDTARRDALSCYGNPRETTPYLDKVASEGLMFLNAFAPASWTPPSHASMFSGFYPSTHGTFSDQVFLKKDFPTLAGLFSEQGFETLSLSSKDVLRKSFGWARGFDHAITVNLEDKASFFYQRIIDKFLNGESSQTPLIMDIAIRWLELRNRSRPFFLFINVSDPHSPYTPREPFINDCCDQIEMSMVDKMKVHNSVKNQHALAMYNEKKINLTRTEFDYVRCLYDSEANFMDGHIGRLFSKLKNLQDGRKTIALITSDHGELLGEHDLMSHGDYLFNELIHIPFIIWGFSEYGICEEPVSLVDVLPTLLHIAGIQKESELSFEGRNIFELVEDRELYSESWTGDIAKKAILFRDFKFLWESSGNHSLYSFQEDPAEIVNLIETKANVAQALHDVLSTKFDLSGQKDLSKEKEAKNKALKLLKSLGYIR